MEINVNFLENLKLEACFDDFKVTTDQPVRYKGDGSAPSPFDYFLASSALCAAYFVRVYCKARQIPTEDIRISQHNVIAPDNRYQQSFRIAVELPDYISERDKTGILRSIDRCSVKKVIQQGPEFIIEAVDTLGQEAGLVGSDVVGANGTVTTTTIPGKDLPLGATIVNMTRILESLGIKIEIASWRNIVPHVWSVHIRDAASPMCYTNGKGSSKEAALCSALGEYIERISCNYFYNDHFLGEEVSRSSFVHYPDEKWFLPGPEDSLPDDLLDAHCRSVFDPEDELRAAHLFDANSGNQQRGICAIPFLRYSDRQTVYFPVNLVGNLYVSNGMSAGNTVDEAKVQCLSEIFERAVKRQIIEQELVLPNVPVDVLQRYPQITAGIADLESQGFPVLIKDASLGGQFPVMCVALMNPRTGGLFASFGAHPRFEVALERSLTELLQGRSFEGLNDVPPPTFKTLALTEPNNFVEHFIDSTGVISWKFLSDQTDFAFCDWNFSGTTAEEFDFLAGIMRDLGKEMYVAVYENFGAKACRILVPGFSEIYPVEDLVWDNTNKALAYRESILNIHKLNDEQLSELAEQLEESQLDNYTKVAVLIGIEFDENTVWGQLDIGELKILIYLALGELENAKPLVERFLAYNENTVERGRFYQALDAVLHITLDPDLQIADYQNNLERMFGKEVITDVIGSVTGKVRFAGLTPTSMALEGLEKHKRLIESYVKLHRARAWEAGLS